MKFLLSLMLFAGVTLSVSGQAKVAPKKATPESGEVKSYPVKNMVKADTTKLPAGLKTTLSQEQYKGWKNGTLYFDKKTQEYALLLNDSISQKLKNNTEIAGKVTSKQTGWHFFTRDGKPIDVAQ